jgi:hypothetical protein
MTKKCLLLILVFPAFFNLSCRTMKKSTPSLEIKKEAAPLPKTDAFLSDLLGQFPQHFDSLLRKNDTWCIRIIYTQIDRNGSNEPCLTHYYYNIDPGQYFYPASTVKFPTAVLALQKLNELNIPGLDKHTTMITEGGGIGLRPVYNDPSGADGRPTIAHYIKKIFLVSDNDAHNRLYEFLGQEYLNSTLHKMGFDSVQLLHRLQISLTEKQNRTTNPIRFFDTAGKLVYEQPLVVSQLPYQPRQTFLGKGYIANGSLVTRPFDFSAKNRFSLTDLHSVLQSVIFPESVPAKQRFNLTEEDYRFLYNFMSRLPRESRFPQYDQHYTDGYVKFLLFGGDGPITNPSLRIFNKAGDAYGFLTDAAYVVDFEKGVEFMLSASISCNSDGIYNDDKYEYDTVGFPFMKRLGEVIYDYETKREKKQLPELSKFKISYSQ